MSGNLLPSWMEMANSWSEAHSCQESALYVVQNRRSVQKSPRSGREIEGRVYSSRRQAPVPTWRSCSQRPMLNSVFCTLTAMKRHVSHLPGHPELPVHGARYYFALVAGLIILGGLYLAVAV